MAGHQATHAQGTAFDYQGFLSDGGSPAAGSYDLRFTVYDATNTPGTLIAGPVTNLATAVSNGLFNVSLDFGPGVFAGQFRCLQVEVRTNGASIFTSLWPRQPVQPVPYSVMANTASNLLGTLPVTQLAGTVPLGQLPAAVVTNGGSFSGTFSGNGAGLTNLNASQLYGTLPAASLPGSAVTNGQTLITSTNAIVVPDTTLTFTNPRYVYVEDNWNGDPADNGRGFFLTVGTNPVVLPSQPAGLTRLAWTDNNPGRQGFTVPKIYRYFSNGVPVKYIVAINFVYGYEPGLQVGFTTSTDLTNWTPLVTPIILSGYLDQWSPTLAEGPTNDLHLITGNLTGPLREVVCVDLNPADLSDWSNYRVLEGCTNAIGSSPGGALVLYSNGLWWVFATSDTTSDEGYPNYIYTNASLSSTGWGRVASSPVYASAPSMVSYNGSNLLFWSYGSYLQFATNLVNWSDPQDVYTTYAGEGGLCQLGLQSDPGWVASTNTLTLTSQSSLNGGIATESAISVGQVTADSISAAAASISEIAAHDIVSDFVFSPTLMTTQIDDVQGAQMMSVIMAPQDNWVRNLVLDGGALVFDNYQYQITVNRPIVSGYNIGASRFYGNGSGLTGLTPSQVGAQPASAALSNWATLSTNVLSAINNSYYFRPVSPYTENNGGGSVYTPAFFRAADGGGFYVAESDLLNGFTPLAIPIPPNYWQGKTNYVLRLMIGTTNAATLALDSCPYFLFNNLATRSTTPSTTQTFTAPPGTVVQNYYWTNSVYPFLTNATMCSYNLGDSGSSTNTYWIFEGSISFY
jgi:hypothetical protein